MGQRQSVDNKEEALKEAAKIIRVEIGDVTEYKADALVCVMRGPENQPIWKGSISEAYKRRGREQLDKAYSSTKWTKCNCGVYTDAQGDLKKNSKIILFIHLQRFSANDYVKQLQEMSKKIRWCIETVINLKLKSIAFPSLGCGKLEYCEESIARCFLEALIGIASRTEIKVTVVALDQRAFQNLSNYLSVGATLPRSFEKYATSTSVAEPARSFSAKKDRPTATSLRENLPLTIQISDIPKAGSGLIQPVVDVSTEEKLTATVQDSTLHKSLINSGVYVKDPTESSSENKKQPKISQDENIIQPSEKCEHEISKTTATQQITNNEEQSTKTYMNTSPSRSFQNNFWFGTSEPIENKTHQSSTTTLDTALPLTFQNHGRSATMPIQQVMNKIGQLCTLSPDSNQLQPFQNNNASNDKFKQSVTDKMEPHCSNFQTATVSQSLQTDDLKKSRPIHPDAESTLQSTTFLQSVTQPTNMKEDYTLSCNVKERVNQESNQPTKEQLAFTLNQSLQLHKIPTLIKPVEEQTKISDAIPLSDTRYQFFQNYNIPNTTTTETDVSNAIKPNTTSSGSSLTQTLSDYDKSTCLITETVTHQHDLLMDKLPNSSLSQFHNSHEMSTSVKQVKADAQSIIASNVQNCEQPIKKSPGITLPESSESHMSKPLSLPVEKNEHKTVRLQGINPQPSLQNCDITRSISPQPSRRYGNSSIGPNAPFQIEEDILAIKLMNDTQPEILKDKNASKTTKSVIENIECHTTKPFSEVLSKPTENYERFNIKSTESAVYKQKQITTTSTFATIQQSIQNYNISNRKPTETEIDYNNKELKITTPTTADSHLVQKVRSVSKLNLQDMSKRDQPANNSKDFSLPQSITNDINSNPIISNREHKEQSTSTANAEVQDQSYQNYDSPGAKPFTRYESVKDQSTTNLSVTSLSQSSQNQKFSNLTILSGAKIEQSTSISYSDNRHLTLLNSDTSGSKQTKITLDKKMQSTTTSPNNIPPQPSQCYEYVMIGPTLPIIVKEDNTTSKVTDVTFPKSLQEQDVSTPKKSNVENIESETEKPYGEDRQKPLENYERSNTKSTKSAVYKNEQIVTTSVSASISQSFQQHVISNTKPNETAIECNSKELKTTTLKTQTATDPHLVQKNISVSKLDPQDMTKRDHIAIRSTGISMPQSFTNDFNFPTTFTKEEHKERSTSAPHAEVREESNQNFDRSGATTVTSYESIRNQFATKSKSSQNQKVSNLTTSIPEKTVQTTLTSYSHNRHLSIQNSDNFDTNQTKITLDKEMQSSTTSPSNIQPQPSQSYKNARIWPTSPIIVTKDNLPSKLKDATLPKPVHVQDVTTPKKPNVDIMESQTAKPYGEDCQKPFENFERSNIKSTEYAVYKMEQITTVSTTTTIPQASQQHVMSNMKPNETSIERYSKEPTLKIQTTPVHHLVQNVRSINKLDSQDTNKMDQPEQSSTDASLPQSFTININSNPTISSREHKEQSISAGNAEVHDLFYQNYDSPGAKPFTRYESVKDQSTAKSSVTFLSQSSQNRKVSNQTIFSGAKTEQSTSTSYSDNRYLSLKNSDISGSEKTKITLDKKMQSTTMSPSSIPPQPSQCYENSRIGPTLPVIVTKYNTTSKVTGATLPKSVQEQDVTTPKISNVENRESHTAKPYDEDRQKPIENYESSKIKSTESAVCKKEQIATASMTSTILQSFPNYNISISKSIATDIEKNNKELNTTKQSAPVPHLYQNDRSLSKLDQRYTSKNDQPAINSTGNVMLQPFTNNISSNPIISNRQHKEQFTSAAHAEVRDQSYQNYDRPGAKPVGAPLRITNQSASNSLEVSLPQSSQDHMVSNLTIRPAIELTTEQPASTSYPEHRYRSLQNFDISENKQTESIINSEELQSTTMPHNNIIQQPSQGNENLNTKQRLMPSTQIVRNTYSNRTTELADATLSTVSKSAQNYHKSCTKPSESLGLEKMQAPTHESALAIAREIAHEIVPDIMNNTSAYVVKCSSGGNPILKNNNEDKFHDEYNYGARPKTWDSSKAQSDSTDSESETKTNKISNVGVNVYSNVQPEKSLDKPYFSPKYVNNWSHLLVEKTKIIDRNTTHEHNQTSGYGDREERAKGTKQNTSHVHNRTSRFGYREVNTNCGIGLNRVLPDLPESNSERYIRELRRPAGDTKPNNDNHSHITRESNINYPDNVAASNYPPKPHQSLYDVQISGKQNVNLSTTGMEDFKIDRTDTIISLDLNNNKTGATAENDKIKLIKIEPYKTNGKSTSQSLTKKESKSTLCEVDLNTFEANMKSRALNETISSSYLVNLPLPSNRSINTKSQVNLDNNSAIDSLASRKQDNNNKDIEGNILCTILQSDNMNNKTETRCGNVPAAASINARQQANLNRVHVNGGLQVSKHDMKTEEFGIYCRPMDAIGITPAINFRNDKEISVENKVAVINVKPSEGQDKNASMCKLKVEPCSKFDLLDSTSQNFNNTISTSMFIFQSLEERLEVYAANYDSYRNDGGSAQRGNIRVINKDITEVQADVLVCHLCGGSGDPYKSGPICRLFMEKGSPELLNAYSGTSGDLGDLVKVTESYGELRNFCNNVFFINIREYSPGYSNDCLVHMINRIEWCLVELSKLKLRSIAFPSMGCGLMNYPPSSVARCFRCVIDVLTAALDLDIQVTIATIDADIYAQFLEFFPEDIPIAIADAPAPLQGNNEAAVQLENVSKTKESTKITYPSYWPKLGKKSVRKKRVNPTTLHLIYPLIQLYTK